MKKSTFFVDTNFFLHCKPVHELRWRDVAPGVEDIRLLVPRAVVEEVDNHKTSPSKRRARKARKVARMFKDMLSRGGSKTYDLESLTITLEFGPRHHSKDYEVLPDVIDAHKNDDRIVGDVWLHNNSTEEKACILTHDTALMLTASHFDVPHEDFPESWLLPNEPDERDKQISELKDELRTAKHALPDLRIVPFVADQQPSEEWQAIVTLRAVTGLSESTIQALVEEAKEISPMKTDFESEKTKQPNPSASLTLLGFRRYVPPTDAEIAQYKHTDYPNWVARFEDSLRNMIAWYEAYNRIVTFSFELSNEGNVPAENCLFTIEAVNGAQLLPPDGVIARPSENSLPLPPKPPQGEWKSTNPMFEQAFDTFRELQQSGARGQFVSPDALLPHPQARRDINAFYWKNGRPNTEQERWEFECEEFRHKERSELFEVEVELPEGMEKAVFEVSASARNLPSPIQKRLILNIRHINEELRSTLAQLVHSRLDAI